MGPAFAAPGTTLKAVTENAITENIAIIEIVFMFAFQQGFPSVNMVSSSREYDYKKIHAAFWRRAVTPRVAAIIAIHRPRCALRLHHVNPA
jgi:hypothetical protein